MIILGEIPNNLQNGTAKKLMIGIEARNDYLHLNHNYATVNTCQNWVALI